MSCCQSVLSAYVQSLSHVREQYSRVKQLDNFAKDEQIDLLTIKINDAHCWNSLKISEIGLPENFSPVIVMRDSEAMLPVNDLSLKTGDTVILASGALTNAW